MIVFDSIIIGLYLVLNNTVYSNSSLKKVHVEDHAILLALFLYSVNIITIVQITNSYYNLGNYKPYLILLLCSILLIVFVVSYWKNKRSKLILQAQRSTYINLLYVLVSLIFFVFSLYLNYKVVLGF
jgi:membrane protease YdiL (CAAX protease family)